MKALLVFTFPGVLSHEFKARIVEQVRGFMRGTSESFCLVDGGAKVEVLYLPDNFTDANCYTPEEAQMLAERIRAASVVVGE